MFNILRTHYNTEDLKSFSNSVVSLTNITLRRLNKQFLNNTENLLCRYSCVTANQQTYRANLARHESKITAIKDAAKLYIQIVQASGYSRTDYDFYISEYMDFESNQDIKSHLLSLDQCLYVRIGHLTDDQI